MKCSNFYFRLFFDLLLCQVRQLTQDREVEWTRKFDHLEVKNEHLRLEKEHFKRDAEQVMMPT